MKLIIHIIALLFLATSCGPLHYKPMPDKLNDSQYHKPTTLAAKSLTPEKVRVPDGYVRFVTPKNNSQKQSQPRVESQADQADDRYTAVVNSAIINTPPPAPSEVEEEVEEHIIAVEDLDPDNSPVDPSEIQADVDYNVKDNQHPSKTSHNPFVNGKLKVDLDKESLNFTYPIDGKYSSGYGSRGRGWHSGVDLTAPYGTPIYAAFDGRVRMSKPYGGYGNLIVITHANGLETAYSHNSKNLVVEGQRVKSGDKIALCGRTGRASGNHLHFEIRVSGVTINPALMLNYTLKTIQSGTLTVSKSGSKIYATRGGDSQDDQQRTVPPKEGALLASSTATSPKVDSSPKPTTQTSQPVSTSKPAVHTIVKGDTLYSIAKRNGLTVDKICQLNQIQKTIILKIGSKLKLR